jgi:hypothetical protein
MSYSKLRRPDLVELEPKVVGADHNLICDSASTLSTACSDKVIRFGQPSTSQSGEAPASNGQAYMNDARFLRSEIFS